MSNSQKAAAAEPSLEPATLLPTALAPPFVLSAAASYAGFTPQPPAYEPAAAATFLAAFRPRLDAIAPADLLIPRLDIRAASLAALGVYTFVAQAPGVLARFQKQATIGEFDIANVEGLKAVSFLVFFTHAQAEAAGAFATDAKVPASLMQEAIEVEGRMQELCEYKFKRDPKIAPLLALLRPGSGYRDIAGDLLGYANIYVTNPKEVASETTNYVATDVADARRIAGDILAHLSAAMSPKAREAYELMQRVWTLLVQIYFEVQEVGMCLLRRDPKRDERFPSLYAAGKSGRPKKKKKKDEAALATPDDDEMPGPLLT